MDKKFNLVQMIIYIFRLVCLRMGHLRAGEKAPSIGLTGSINRQVLLGIGIRTGFPFPEDIASSVVGVVVNEALDCFVGRY